MSIYLNYPTLLNVLGVLSAVESLSDIYILPDFFLLYTVIF